MTAKFGYEKPLNISGQVSAFDRFRLMLSLVVGVNSVSGKIHREIPKGISVLAKPEPI
ncbi:hypothetical protein D3C76_1863770 [compost metagenome]